MKPIKAWAIVQNDGAIEVFPEKQLAIYRTRQRTAEVPHFGDSRIVRVEIREVQRPAKRLTRGRQNRKA